MFSQTLELCLVRQFLLPVELRKIIKQYFAVSLTNETIHEAVRIYCDAYRIRERTRKKVRRPVLMRYGPIQEWDTSNVTNMYGLFCHQREFNEDISRWDVSNVTTMENMFLQATLFNQPISNWDVSKVVNMSYMFFQAKHFNQSLEKWNLRKVENTYCMFRSIYEKSFLLKNRILEK